LNRQHHLEATCVTNAKRICARQEWKINRRRHARSAEPQGDAGLCIQINDTPYSNDLACHLKPDGTLTVKIWHMQAMLQPPTSRAAKLITGIGHDVEDDHLRHHDAARAREWIYYTKAHW